MTDTLGSDSADTLLPSGWIGSADGPHQYSTGTVDKSLKLWEKPGAGTTLHGGSAKQTAGCSPPGSQRQFSACEFPAVENAGLRPASQGLRVLPWSENSRC
ncbi:hypothetical protein GCM10009771_23890 [Nesterenkonia flava]